MSEAKRELDNLESICWINDTEISHLLMSHADEYNHAELSGFIAHEAAITIDELRRTVRELQAELEADKWISVKDRLPNTSTRVLALTTDNAPVVVYLDVHEGWCGDSFYSECGQCTTLLMGEVTHWQPLPEPPKECE